VVLLRGNPKKIKKTVETPACGQHRQHTPTLACQLVHIFSYMRKQLYIKLASTTAKGARSNTLDT